MALGLEEIREEEL